TAAEDRSHVHIQTLVNRLYGKGQETNVGTESFLELRVTLSFTDYFQWHPRFEPFVSSVVVDVAAVVVIGAAVAVIVEAKHKRDSCLEKIMSTRNIDTANKKNRNDK
ncbi:hypothetical protein Tco_1205511, partial [Tanacetum coccineum]